MKTKMRNLKALFAAVVLLCSCTSHTPKNQLQFIFDGVHNTPCEPKTVSKYNDPNVLRQIGCNGITPHWHIQCAITYDSFDKGIIPEGSPEREWILAKQNDIRREIRRAKEAGIKVYPTIDILVLPTLLAEKYKDQIARDQPEKHNNYSALHGRISPDINKPMTKKLVAAQIREIFETFPEVDGLVTRVGETYLFDTPYHSGSSPVGTQGEEGRIAGHIELLNLFRSEICERYDRKLFYRTWDFLFLHTRTDVFTKVMSQVEPHDNLLLSIKYSKGDFHRLTKFNPTIGLCDHNYIVEIQAQPEYYGKGSHPVYIFGGVLNGFVEYEQNMSSDDPYHSLRELRRDPKFQGVWSWSRGGGWRGPYIKNEIWCDVNAMSIAEWAQDTTRTEREVLRRSLTKIGVKENSIDPFIEILHKADEGVVKGQCSLIDITKYSFRTNWARDQYITGEGGMTSFMNYIVKNDLGDEMMREKDEAVQLWREIENLSKQIEMNDEADELYVRTSSSYGRIKYELFREIFKIFYYSKLNALKGVKETEKMREAIANYDAIWAEWHAFVESHPESATIYEPNAFHLGSIADGVSGDPKGGIGATVDKYRAW